MENLLLHGAIGAKDQVDNLKERLSNEYNVLCFNFSGHEGEVFNDYFNIRQFSKEVIDDNQIEKVNIFDYSMWGYVALFTAKHFANRVEKIVTLGTKFKWTPEISAKEVKMLDPYVLENKVPAFAEVLKLRHGVTKWADLLERTADMMLEMGEDSALSLSDYSEISHPCKIMLADADEMVNNKETKEVVGLLPDAIFKEIKNSKHPIEKVDITLLLEEIKNFM